ncbi:WD40/YVTN/BNR-like repeat-containing protein [Terriglobus roseus]|uniref:Photosynthesis system II assembly factor Ycf48/Hcf136-like domain-containing protein n=1 Tax=Terriglobus roseus TaxID=392734 RepID=A0A1H4N970_9BACT|nr:hypothetical protein [Terriglobus roseus]SEB91876.1 Uncharacterized protein SAMN05443244_2180 [Terriglobus roseus]
MICRLFVAVLIVPALAHAQFTVQASHTTASLRGIANVDGQVAWASGTAGTVLKTLDGGTHWVACATPAGAEKLDFRGIQAFDDKTALVMSSGKGDLSRVYKTSDGCVTWQLLFTNPDAPDGFFDAMYFMRRDEGWLLGDPVKGNFYVGNTSDGGATWTRSKSPDLNEPTRNIGAFAASNQSFTVSLTGPIFGGGAGYLYRGSWPGCSQSQSYNQPELCLDRIPFDRLHLPLQAEGAAAGIFAVVATTEAVVAVGGDYTQPANPAMTAAVSLDDGLTWHAAVTQPHGYRSTVAYDVSTKTWITAGPNGTDISRDNGIHWTPLQPDNTKGDASDADRDWNAISLPFVVGPKGRIGKLRAESLKLTR